MRKKIFLSCISCTAILFVVAQNVGIGNSNPGYRLDLSGRMRLRGGTDYNNSAGLWLGGSGADSAVKKIFIGMRTDSSAGFYSERPGRWLGVGI